MFTLADIRICRIAGVACVHIYAMAGMMASAKPMVSSVGSQDHFRFSVNLGDWHSTL